VSKAPLDYSSAGVDYQRIDALKVRAQQAARGTSRHLAAHGCREIERSRGESAYVVEAGGVLLASVTECLGTKALVADAVRPISGRTHYDAIAQDTIAMAVNDLITVGATPLSVQAYWAAGSSDWFSDIERMTDLVRGWQAACDVCQVAWGGGETPALAGVVEPDGGRVTGAGGATRTLQGNGVFPTLTTLEHVLVGSSGRRREAGFFRALLATPRFRAEQAAFEAEARAVLTRFDLLARDVAGTLPAGAQRRLMLASAYATGSAVLLVDEPTAGASATEAAGIVELLAALRSEGLGLLVVEHNLPVVRRIADRIVVLDAGTVIADGPPDAVAADPRVRAAYLGTQLL